MSRRFGYTVAVIFALFALACLGLVLPLDFLAALTIGWAFYLARVLPEVRLSPDGLATGAVCLAVFAFGAHAFLRWLYRETTAGGSWRPKWTAWLVAGVLLMFTAGLAATGVVHQLGWFVTSPVPIVSSDGIYGARGAAARRAQSANNLKQIALGVVNYDRSDLSYPPGATAGPHGEFLHSWQGLIAPYLSDDKPISLDFSRPWDAPENAAAVHTLFQQFLIPSVSPTQDASGLPLSHYEGNARVVGGTRARCPADVPDGSANTILAGEVAGGYLPWAQPGHWRDPADGINRAPDRGFGGPFPGGASVVFLDGSVRFIKNTVHPSVLKALSTPDGGEPVSAESY